MTPTERSEFWNPFLPPPLELRVTPSDHQAPLVPRVLELQFRAFPYHGQPTSVFAYAALHPEPSSHPTAILVHGYNGLAAQMFDASAQKYFPLGYNILALDLPGQRESGAPSRSTGVDMNFATIYAQGDLHDSYYWHAVQATRRLIDAAAELDCNTSRLLLEGASLGGMTVLATAAADPRPVPGALRGASRGWRDAFDFLRQPQRPELPLYIVTASNDEWFAFPDQIVARNLLGRTRLRLAVGPNLDHTLSPHLYGGINAFRRAFAHGASPAWAELSHIEKNHSRLTFHLSGPAASFQLVSAPANTDLAAIDWHALKWHVQDLPLESNTATCPASAIAGRIFYAHVTSQDGAVDSSVLFDSAASEFNCSLSLPAQPPEPAQVPI